MGCGKSSEQQTETTEPQQVMRTQQPFERPAHIPLSRASNPLTPAIMDTLRRLRDAHNVTRDEQWTGKGGVLGNDFFEVWYPEGRTMITHGMRVLNDMMFARAKFERYVGQVPMERLVILLPPYMEQYTEWTGREYWHYSEIRSDTMTIQPLYVLIRRGLVDYALPHEYFQWAIGRVTNFGAPRWLEEGVASYLSREGGILAQQLVEFPKEAHSMSPEQIEKALLREESRQATRIAYYHAHRMVKTLVDDFGEEKLKEMILLLGQGYTMGEVCRQTYGMSFENVLESTMDNADKI